MTVFWYIREVLQETLQCYVRTMLRMENTRKCMIIAIIWLSTLLFPRALLCSKHLLPSLCPFLSVWSHYFTVANRFLSFRINLFSPTVTQPRKPWNRQIFSVCGLSPPSPLILPNFDKIKFHCWFNSVPLKI